MRNTRTLTIATAIAAVLCGVVLALFILWTTGRGGTPRTYEPFNAGYEAALRKTLVEGGPFYYADPFGGDQGFWFALEDGQIVAAAVSQPDDPKCSIRWRGSRNTFVDCHDEPRTLNSLARYDLTVRDQNGQPVVFVNLQALMPPPNPSAGG